MSTRLPQHASRTLTSRRWRGALMVAVLSDVIGFGIALVPPVQWLLDAVTAGVLFAVLGFRWPLLPALAVEVVPGLAVFPAWTLVVAALAATNRPLRGDAKPSDVLPD